MLSLKLLPDIRGLMLAAFRIADVIRINFSFPLARAVHEGDLLDYELLAMLRHRVEQTPVGGAIKLSDPELVFVYFLLDLLGKSYFSTLGDFLKKEYLAQSRGNDADFADYRSQTLKVAERVLEHLSRYLAGNSSFMKVKERLEELEPFLG